MGLFDRVVQDLKNRRKRVITGQVNCIPWELSRFSEHLPGIEKGRYYIVTGNQKAGKSKISDYLFVYHALMYAYNNPSQLRIRIKYFTLELSKEECFINLISYFLYELTDHRIRKSPMILRSTNSKYPIEKGVLDMIESDEFKPFFRFFEERVEFIDSIRTPEAIYNNCVKYCEEHGVIRKKTINVKDELTGLEKVEEIDSFYKPNDPEEYFIVIVDNASLVSQSNHKDLRSAIFDLSAHYFVKLRNIFNATIVLIQQQMQAQEDAEHVKLNMLSPTVNGLADNKSTGRDANYVLGIFSPHRHHKKDYCGYDITRWRDNIRFLEVVTNRHGQAGIICPLMFLGDVGYFEELPKPTEITDEHYQKMYNKPDPIIAARLFFLKAKHVLQNITSFSIR